MLGTHVESIDFNLPVDAVTEKPLFAFSCNRIIRENYDGPLMRAVDNTDIGVDDLSANVGKQINLLYDQKVRHGHASHDAVGGTVYPTLQGNQTDRYYLEFNGLQYFDISSTELLDKAGVMVVCNPEGQGRKPVFTANNGVDELSLDIGTAYMRFNYYGPAEKEDLFGGLDYPDDPKNGYIANYDEQVLLDTPNGKGGEFTSSRQLSGVTSLRIGLDMAGSSFEGKLYELVICDFPVPVRARTEVFDNWTTFYSLT